MGQGNDNLAALIGSRICHDLISPIGAIHNGLELLDMAGAVEGPEMGLIADSVSNAEARIRFFRLAYGAAGDQQIARSEVVAVLRDMGKAGRLSLEWMPLDPQPRCDVRLALLAVQCLETAMPYGGTIRVDRPGPGWSVTGEAERLVLDPALWSGLTDPDIQAEITPALVQFGLMPMAVVDAGRHLEVTTSGQRIEMTF
ncbi:histidine phosphotransferase family protein [Marinibacterium sp. SX1]|uniref:histidine phosphotransferase family protein n=1 Tax=Marinibacterium sp. SX1 TaxID=3388424 RepID=UPI003D162796